MPAKPPHKPTLEQRLTRDPNLLKKYLGNAGLRSKVPDKMLPAQQLATRRANAKRAQEDATLYNPGHQLAGTDLRSAVNSIVDGQTRPQLDALDREQGVAERQGQMLTDRAAGYYKQFADLEKQNLGAVQGVDAQALAAVRQANANAQGQVDAATAGVQGRAAQDAAVRGGVAGSDASAVLNDLAARRASIAATGAADETFSAGTGAAAERGQVARSGVAAQKGGEVVGDIAGRVANRLGDIGAKRRSVVENRGNLRTDTLLKMRQAGFDNAITQAGLQLKEEDLSTSAAAQAAAADERARHNQQMESAADQRNATTRHGQGLSHQDRVAARRAADRRAAAKGNGNGSTGLTPVQLEAARRKASDRWNDMLAAKNTYATLRRLDPNLSPDLLIQALRQRGVKDGLILRTVQDWDANKGRLSDGMVAEWKRQHFNVPQNRRTATLSSGAAGSYGAGRAPGAGH